MAANSSNGWYASLKVEAVIKARADEMTSAPDKSSLPGYIMPDIKDLAARGIIEIIDDTVVLTEDGIALVESLLPQEARFPCEPRIPELSTIQQKIPNPPRPEHVHFAVLRLFEKCWLTIGRKWKGFKLIDLATGKDAAEDGFSYCWLASQGLVRVTKEGCYTIIHPTPALVRLILGE